MLSDIVGGVGGVCGRFYRVGGVVGGRGVYTLATSVGLSHIRKFNNDQWIIFFALLFRRAISVVTVIGCGNPMNSWINF